MRKITRKDDRLVGYGFVVDLFGGGLADSIDVMANHSTIQDNTKGIGRRVWGRISKAD
jgi:hypothetical protein